MANTVEKPLKPYALLLSVLRYDVEKRFSVLKDEIQHLQNSVTYRIAPKPEGETSQAAFLGLLRKSGKTLAIECESDLEEILAFRATWGRHAARRNQLEAADAKFAILWHAKMLHKGSVIAERIGDLHDRLEQFLQRTVPDHPDTTLRRRTEQGLTDKYLSELSRWAHRDLARFTISMGANYPYKEVPSTYQFWAYDHTSRHHAFISSHGHAQWQDYVEGKDKRAPIEPEKFVSVALSYWMPERVSLQPIIGHELAHQVLRDLYGREVNFPLLEQDESEFGRTYRRLTTCVETWTLARAESGRLDVKATSNLVQEVLCDVMAAQRFGYAYAYAWLLEMLSDVQLASLSHDQYGMLRKLSPNGPVDSLDRQYAELRRDVLLNAQFLRNVLPRAYIRGVALLRFLRHAARETDRAALELGEAFDHLLGVLLDLYDGEATPQNAFDREFARDLATTLCEEWRALSVDSGFVNSARRYWDTKLRGRSHAHEPALDRQVISQGLRLLMANVLDEPDGFSWPSVRLFTDAAWRIEWYLQRKDDQHPLAESLRNKVRSIYFLGMDDYVYRTGNPARLFHAIEPTVPYTPQPTNSVAADVIVGIYSPRQLEDYDAALQRAREAGSANFCVPSLNRDFSTAGSRWIQSLILDAPRWRRLVGATSSAGPEEQLVLELFRFRDDGALGRGVEMASDGRYEAISTGLVLGSYDAFAVSRLAKPEAAGMWSLSEQGQRKKASYVSRIKKLVPIGQLTRGSAPALALILVSLKWDASRTVVARWLLDASLLGPFPSISKQCFLSDGWEDLVIMVCASQSKEGHCVTDDALRLIDLLNQNPFVASTETLFTAELLSHPSDLFYFRLLCRVGQKGYAQLKPKLLDARDQLGLEVHNTAGNRDFEIIIPHPKYAQLRDIYGELRTRLGGCALEVRVGWDTTTRSRGTA